MGVMFIGDRVTTKGTQYTGGGNIFVPDFNKLPYLLRSQGDNNFLHQFSVDIEVVIGLFP